MDTLPIETAARPPRSLKPWLAIFCVATIGFSIGILILREPLDPLHAQDLDAARQRWEAAGIRSYDMTLNLAGNSYKLQVRDSIVVEFTSEGRPVESNRPGDYSVDGIFDTLERELELRDDPANPFGGERGTTILLVRFDPQLGYVQRYSRTLGGTGRTSSLEITQFTVHASDSP